MEPKMVIVVRRDLNMGKGKLAAQVAHAALSVFIKEAELKLTHSLKRGKTTRKLSVPMTEPAWLWLSKSFTKIVCYVDTEADLLALYISAKNLKLPCALVTDEGRTEFNGVATTTCVAIGPEDSDKIDKLTKGLPLY